MHIHQPEHILHAKAYSEKPNTYLKTTLFTRLFLPFVAYFINATVSLKPIFRLILERIIKELKERRVTGGKGLVQSYQHGHVTPSFLTDDL